MSLKFLTYNIWYGKFWQKVARFVKKINPDIAVFQEVTTFFPDFDLERVNVLEELLKALPKLKYSAFAQILKRKKDGKLQQLGNAIFSKFPILKQKAHYFHKSADWSRHQSESQARNLLTAEVKINKENLFVTTTHLTYTPWFKDIKIRLEEAAKLLKIVKDKEPMLLAGDFNGPPDSKVIRMIANKYHFADEKLRPTFTKYPFKTGDFEVKGLSYKLDYIFYSQKLKLKSCQLIDTNAADHLPLLAEFEL